MRDFLIKFTLFLSIPLFFGCNAYISDNEILENENINEVSTNDLISENKKTIYTRFKTPVDFFRIKPINDFGFFIHHLPLKSDKLKARLYDGTEKINTSAYVGVIDLQQPDQNIQFNGNAIFRLRAEYLYKTQQYDKIDFRTQPHQDLLSFIAFANQDYSRKKFNEYLVYLLSNISPTSLKDHLKPIPFQEMQIGDVLLQRTQNRGHAAIIVDLAMDKNGNKLFTLAQALYPSQDIYIASNQENEELSPWYPLQNGPILTPEWRFFSQDLMRFK